jgi:hypothetical protein
MDESHDNFLFYYRKIMSLVMYSCAFCLFYYWPLFTIYVLGNPPSEQLRFYVSYVFVPFGFIATGYLYGKADLRRNIILLVFAAVTAYFLTSITTFNGSDVWGFSIFSVFVVAALLSQKTIVFK